MSELEVVKEAVGQPPPPPKKFIKGQTDSPGGLRMSYSVDESGMFVKREMLDFILDEMATLLNIAALDLPLAIEILHFASERNEDYRFRLAGAPDVYGEAEGTDD